MQARGVDLPPLLDSDLFDQAPVAERRLWLSLVYRCVVVRGQRRWREPAADRARLVLVDEAPADSARLIDWVARVDG